MWSRLTFKLKRATLERSLDTKNCSERDAPKEHRLSRRKNLPYYKEAFNLETKLEVTRSSHISIGYVRELRFLNSFCNGILEAMISYQSLRKPTSSFKKLIKYTMYTQGFRSNYGGFHRKKNKDPLKEYPSWVFAAYKKFQSGRIVCREAVNSQGIRLI